MHCLSQNNTLHLGAYFDLMCLLTESILSVFLNGDIRNLFHFRDTILMRKEGLLSSGTINGHRVICYPEQLAFVQEYFGDLADIAAVTMDDLENVLEIDRPSLIE